MRARAFYLLHLGGGNQHTAFSAMAEAFFSGTGGAGVGICLQGGGETVATAGARRKSQSN